MVLVVVFNLAIIVFLKFYTPVANLLNTLFGKFGWNAQVPSLKLVLPLGISFYTLQAIGYLVDVYRKKLPAEKNFFKVALFLCFFPQILEGPIAKYDQTAEQLYEGHKFDYKQVAFGAQRVLWGLLKKNGGGGQIVLACQDRFRQTCRLRRRCKLATDIVLHLATVRRFLGLYRRGNRISVFFATALLFLIVFSADK